MIEAKLSAQEVCDPDLMAKAEHVRQAFRTAGSTLVAFSGGVDSTVLAALAHAVLGPRMLAVTADSETLFPGEVDEARRIATARGWKHLIVRRSELRDPAFAANPENRCYHCKDDLYGMLAELANARGFASVADGTNASDLAGHRPGYEAVVRRGVMRPLVEARLTKAEVRQLARGLALPNCDKPGLACLSSRFPQGQLITLDGLDRVASAESAVRRVLGVELVRVRDLGGTARIEVAAAKVIDAAVRRAELTRELIELGFDAVTIAPEGYRSAPAASLQGPDSA